MQPRGHARGGAFVAVPPGVTLGGRGAPSMVAAAFGMRRGDQAKERKRGKGAFVDRDERKN